MPSPVITVSLKTGGDIRPHLSTLRTLLNTFGLVENVRLPVESNVFYTQLCAIYKTAEDAARAVEGLKNNTLVDCFECTYQEAQSVRNDWLPVPLLASPAEQVQVRAPFATVLRDAYQAALEPHIERLKRDMVRVVSETPLNTKLPEPLDPSLAPALVHHFKTYENVHLLSRVTDGVVEWSFAFDMEPSQPNALTF